MEEAEKIEKEEVQEECRDLQSLGGMMEDFWDMVVI